jgi:hypothetical protein
LQIAENGNEFLTPEGVRQIPLERFEDPSAIVPESERMLREKRDLLVSAYASLIVDRVDHAVPTPGARERALINMGTQRGDPLGEAMRFVMQFKSFGIGMAHRSLGRDIHGGDGPGLSAAMRVGFLAFQLSLFGYLAMSAKELLAGKKPRDPLEPGTVIAAMVQGGGFGILGDFVFGEYNRFGRSLTETLAGPTVGSAADIAELFAKARDTDKMARGKYASDMAASSLRVAVSNTPYANLFWLRPAVNYMMLYPIQESLNPGYLRRMEGRIARENKQEFWLSPRNVVGGR